MISEYERIRKRTVAWTEIILGKKNGYWDCFFFLIIRRLARTFIECVKLLVKNRFECTFFFCVHEHWMSLSENTHSSSRIIFTEQGEWSILEKLDMGHVKKIVSDVFVSRFCWVEQSASLFFSTETNLFEMIVFGHF